MRRALIVGRASVLALAAALSLPALAGHAKCTRSAEDCAAHMKEMFQTRGWAGLDKDFNEDGTITVRAVLPKSPAEKAGIKAGDLLVSMDGVTLSKENEAKIEEMKETGMRIGDTVSFGVKRGKEIVTVKVTLEKIPDAVLAGLIDKHAKEEHQIARN
jgi:S1-C subfamily serine protease